MKTSNHQGQARPQWPVESQGFSLPLKPEKLSLIRTLHANQVLAANLLIDAN